MAHSAVRHDLIGKAQDMKFLKQTGPLFVLKSFYLLSLTVSGSRL